MNTIKSIVPFGDGYLVPPPAAPISTTQAGVTRSTRPQHHRDDG
jgi:hypothetical protein